MGGKLADFDVDAAAQKALDPVGHRRIAGRRAGDIGLCPGLRNKLKCEFSTVHGIGKGLAMLLEKGVVGGITARGNGNEVAKGTEIRGRPEYLCVEQNAKEIHHALKMTHVAGAELDPVTLLIL